LFTLEESEHGLADDERLEKIKCHFLFFETRKLFFFALQMLLLMHPLTEMKLIFSNNGGMVKVECQEAVNSESNDRLIMRKSSAFALVSKTPY